MQLTVSGLDPIPGGNNGSIKLNVKEDYTIGNIKWLLQQPDYNYDPSLYDLRYDDLHSSSVGSMLALLSPMDCKTDMLSCKIRRRSPRSSCYLLGIASHRYTVFSGRLV